MADSSPLSTPKRQRPVFMVEQSPSPIHAAFSFDMNAPPSLPTSGSSSPRSRVAHRFGGLTLADHGPGPSKPVPKPVLVPAAPASGDGVGGGGVTSLVATPRDNAIAKPAVCYSQSRRMQVDENEAMMRKRPKLSPRPDVAASPPPPLVAAAEIPETPNVTKSQPPATADPTYYVPQTGPTPTDGPAQSGTAAAFTFDQAIFSSSPKPSPSKPFLQPLPVAGDRPVEAVKPRVRKRAGTPPLGGSSSEINNRRHATNTSASSVVDPVRAALTWHEDEITSYDPQDEDDDGVGLNGIGFKPTPAIAYARTMRRRQQLADYRKREEKEARARRNLRRRGSPATTAAALDRKKSAARKVRFTEAEPNMMIETI